MRLMRNTAAEAPRKVYRLPISAAIRIFNEEQLVDPNVLLVVAIRTHLCILPPLPKQTFVQFLPSCIAGRTLSVWYI